MQTRLEKGALFFLSENEMRTGSYNDAGSHLEEGMATTPTCLRAFCGYRATGLLVSHGFSQ
jgi:hypothetical protein